MLFAWSLKHKRNWKLKDWLLYPIISKLFQSYSVVLPCRLETMKKDCMGQLDMLGFVADIKERFNPEQITEYLLPENVQECL